MLSQGVLHALQVCFEILTLRKNRETPASLLPTNAAVRQDNELAAGQPVGGLLHSAC